MTYQNKLKIEEEEQLIADLLEEDTPPWQLIVWNDDVNTFDWVIKALIEICQHTEEQAEQCALFIHFKGKYAVKQGQYRRLHAMCDALHDRGISATVEMNVTS